MKKLLLLLTLVSAGINFGFAQQTYYDVTPGNGYGLRFWQTDGYKIHMGNTSEYMYGPVNDYSIKTNMYGGTGGRGWTWGTSGNTPVAAINTLGNMQIAGPFTAGGNIINNNPANGALGLTGDLPGYSNGSYPTLKTNGNYLYFSAVGKYSAYLGGGSGDAVLGLNDASTNVKVSLNTNGNSYLNGGNVGIGTTSPAYKLELQTVAPTKAAYFQTTGSWQAIDFSSDGGVTKGSLSAVGGVLNIGSSASGTNSLVNVNLNSGYVGIGTTTPNAMLQINSAVERNSFRIYKTTSTTNYLSIWQGSGGVGIDPIGTGKLYLGYDQTTDTYVNGKLGIGTTQPDYPLTVNGSVHAKEVRVDLNVPAPDYVFENEYKLASLDEIKSYIDQNKHLPEVPSAKEMEKNGVQLGEMNMLLLKKIEELTLHIIKQEERIKKLEAKENSREK
jgi:hypothetical protein